MTSFFEYQTLDIESTGWSGVYSWNFATGEDSWTGDRHGNYTVSPITDYGKWIGLYLYDIDASAWSHTVYLYREDWGTLTPLLLSIVRNDATPVESRTVSYTVTFNVPVAGVDPTDFRLGGTPVQYIPNAPAAPLGSIYRSWNDHEVFTVTDLGGGVFNVVVDILAGAGALSLDLIDDNTIAVPGLPLNGSDMGTRYVGETYEITDTTRSNLVSVELINGSPTSRDTVDFRFTFDEMMEGPSLVPDSLGTGGGANSHVVEQDVSDGAIVNIAVTLADPDLDGTVNAWVDDGLDMVGLPLATNFSSAAYEIDNAVPIVWDIIRTNAAPRDQNDIAVLIWTVQFDMDVTGVSLDDFVLSGTYFDQTTAAVFTTITSISPGFAPFETDVAVDTGYPNSGSGTIRLDTVVAPTVFDAATGTHQLGGPFTGGEDYRTYGIPFARTDSSVWMLH